MHGATGEVVGDVDVETLTNKIIDNAVMLSTMHEIRENLGSSFNIKLQPNDPSFAFGSSLRASHQFFVFKPDVGSVPMWWLFADNAGWSGAGNAIAINLAGTRNAIDSYGSIPLQLETHSNQNIKLKAHGTGFIDSDKKVQAPLLGMNDGITAPSTVAGKSLVYVDAADGIAKVKHGDGTVKILEAGAYTKKQITPFLIDYRNGGEIESEGGASVWYAIPDADDNAELTFAFHLPTGWNSGSAKVYVRYYLDGANAFSVEWFASCYTTGATQPSQLSNVWNAKTDEDFPGGTTDVIYEKSIAISDADIQADRTLVINVRSDAVNANELRILDIWVEES